MAPSADEKPLYREPVVVTQEQKKTSCCGYRYIKALVILYGLVYLIVGLILFITSVWLLSVKTSYDSISDTATSPAVVALLVALIILATGLIGIIGAIKEKHVLLRIFLAITIVVFILQLVIGILAFVYRDEAIYTVNDKLRYAVVKYTADEDLRYGVDKIQQKFECCGVMNANDWNENRVYDCTSGYNMSCGVPDSCCADAVDQCGWGVRRQNTLVGLELEGVYSGGCGHKFKVWVAGNLDLIGGIGLGLAVLHVLGIFVVYWFITKVDDRRKLFRLRDRAHE